MPTASDLVRLQKKYQKQEITIVAIYASRSSKDAFKKHVKTEGISYSAIYDEENRIGIAYGITNDGRRYPVTPTFLIGRDGRVLWERTEFRHWSKSLGILEALIDAKLKEPFKPSDKEEGKTHDPKDDNPENDEELIPRDGDKK